MYWIFCVSSCFHACQITNQIIYQKTQILYFFWVTAFEFKISTLLNLNNNTKHDLKFQYNFAHLFFNKYVYFCMLSLSQKIVRSKILINILVFDLLIKKIGKPTKLHFYTQYSHNNILFSWMWMWVISWMQMCSCACANSCV